MNNSKKKFYVFGILALLGMATTATTFAFQGKIGGNNLTDDQRTAIETAIENDDYEAWLEATDGLEMFTNMTEDKFEEMVTRRTEQAAQREEMEAQRELVNEALDNGDYEAWLEVAADNMTEVIDTEAKFKKLLEMHQLMEQSRELRDEALVIADELGLPEKGNDMRPENGFMNGNNLMGPRPENMRGLGNENQNAE